MFLVSVFRPYLVVLPIPLSHLYHVDKGLCFLISPDWRIQPCNCRVGTFIGHWIIAVYNKLVKTQINTKSAHCLQAKFVRAISREPIAQSSQSLLYSTRLDLPQGLVASICLISLHIPVTKNQHQNSFLAHCAVDFSRSNSSIISIFTVFDSPGSTAGPGGFNLFNFFTYHCSQN